MKLHVVFNKDGDIMAAAQLDGDSPIQARPIADEKHGHRTAEVDVPKEYGHYNLAAVCQKMRVDAKGKTSVLKAKEN